MFKSLQSLFLLCAVTLAFACGGGGGQPHSEIQDTWWTKTGGGDSTLTDMFMGKDGTFKTSADQKGTYKLTKGEIAVKVDGPGGEYSYEIISASATELKVKFMGHDYIFTPRKE